MNIKRIVKFSLCFFSFTACENAFSWWDQPHQLVGSIAGKNVSNETHEKVLALLKLPISSPGTVEFSSRTNEFDTAGSWADVIKDKNTEYSQCHYTDLLVEKDMIGKMVDNETARHALNAALAEDKLNSVSCLKSAIKTLTDKNQTDTQRAIALRLVIHIVGDIAQPLHNISLVQNGVPDNGGTTTFFPTYVQIPVTDGSSTGQNKLHSLWDASLGTFLQFPYSKVGIYQKADLDLNDYLSTKLMAQEETQNLFRVINESQDSIEDWIIDGYRIAVQHVYTDLTFTWGNYSVPRKDLVKNQILKGGYRLACILEAVFNPANSALSFQKIVYDIKNDPSIAPLVLFIKK